MIDFKRTQNILTDSRVLGRHRCPPRLRRHLADKSSIFSSFDQRCSYKNTAPIKLCHAYNKVSLSQKKDANINAFFLNLKSESFPTPFPLKFYTKKPSLQKFR